MTPDRLIKISAVTAKLAVRLFFILLLVALTMVVQYKDKPGKLGYFNPWQWPVLFPVILILSFLTLLILCTTKKYKVADLNILLIVNTVMLIAYGVVLFFRIAQIAK